MLKGFLISLVLAVIIPFILTRGKIVKDTTSRRRNSRPRRPIKTLPWFNSSRKDRR